MGTYRYRITQSFIGTDGQTANRSIIKTEAKDPFDALKDIKRELDINMGTIISIVRINEDGTPYRGS